MVKLAIRHPALVAKQAGSVAAMSDNRFGFGVGPSPWPEDYDRAPNASRGKRMDECIDIIRGLWTGDFFEFHGDFYDIPAVKITPGADSADPLCSSGARPTPR